MESKVQTIWQFILGIDIEYFLMQCEAKLKYKSQNPE